MEQLFRDFWWLLFPLGWLVAGGFRSFLNYQRQKQALELMRTYAEKGQEPPEKLIYLLGKEGDGEAPMTPQARAERDAASYWSLVALFAVMSLGFAGAGYFTNLDRGTGAFFVVAVTLGAVGVWALVNALMQGRNSR